MNSWISFLWPFMLVGLLLVPLLLWLYVRLRRRRRAELAELGPFGLPLNEAGQKVGRRRELPIALYFASLTLLLFALARPQTSLSLPRIEGTVMLAFDISNSMAADDLEPSRMEAAKAAARAFVDNQPATIRVGIVAFSNGGLIVQPPTHEKSELYNAIERFTPQGGTSLGQGIFTSLNAIAGEQLELGEEAVDPATGTILAENLRLEDYSSAVILLLTDGENTSAPDPLEIAQVAAEAGVRIYAVGVGSEEGTELEVDGFTLVTRLDEPLLTEIASVTNGRYFRADSEEALRAIYETVDLQLTVRAEMMEITALFAGAALLLLLAGGGLNMLWYGRVP